MITKYGKPGDLFRGTDRATGRAYVATVGVSGKLVGRRFL